MTFVPILGGQKNENKMLFPPSETDRFTYRIGTSMPIPGWGKSADQEQGTRLVRKRLSGAGREIRELLRKCEFSGRTEMDGHRKAAKPEREMVSKAGNWKGREERSLSELIINDITAYEHAVFSASCR